MREKIMENVQFSIDDVLVKLQSEVDYWYKVQNHEEAKDLEYVISAILRTVASLKTNTQIAEAKKTSLQYKDWINQSGHILRIK